MTTRRIASLALVLLVVALSIAVSMFCLWAGWNPAEVGQ